MSESALERIRAHMPTYTHTYCRILAHAHAYSPTFSRMYPRIPKKCWRIPPHTLARMYSCMPMHTRAYQRILAHIPRRTRQHSRILAPTPAYTRVYPRILPHTRAYTHARSRNEAFPVLKLYCKQAQSSREPKRGISSTKVVLQASTIQAGAETRHSQY